MSTNLADAVYPRNAARLTIGNLPEGRTVEWFASLVEDPNDAAPLAGLSGSATWDAEASAYVVTISGAALEDARETILGENDSGILFVHVFEGGEDAEVWHVVGRVPFARVRRVPA